MHKIRRKMLVFGGLRELDYHLSGLPKAKLGAPFDLLLALFSILPHMKNKIIFFTVESRSTMLCSV